MLIDFHTHAYRVKCPFGANFCTLEEVLKEQDRLGIDMSCVLPVVSPEIYIPQNTEDIIDMAREYPDRIIPFCNVDPRSLTNSPFAKLEDVLEFYKEKGCKAVGEVMPNMRMDDPKVQNLFRACEKVGFSVTPDGSDMLDGDFGLYDEPGLPQLELSLRRFPNLIIFGHGPIFWGEIAKLDTPGEKGYPFRVEYYTLLNKLYTFNYYKIIYDWCEEHGCKLTGHTVEEPHLFSQMWGSAGAMPSYRYSHVAGIDHLCQAMDGVMDEVQVESVAAQFGIKQVMSESFACTGYDANFRTLKYIAEHQYAQGVNYLVVHLMNYSLQGMGYKDHPQTFSSHAAWWSDFAIFNDYFTKLGYIFANTPRQVNVFLIHPMQDCYLTYDRKQDKKSVLETEESFYALSKELAERGIAFHYADETLLKESGKVEGNALTLGEKAYDYVILPNRKSINASTQSLLNEFVAVGGRLCVLGEYPTYIQGEKYCQPIQSTISYDEILSVNASMIKSDGKLFQRYCRGELGEFIFLLNTDEKEVLCQIPDGWVCVDFENKTFVNCVDNLSLQPKQSKLLKRETIGAGASLTKKTHRADVTENFSVTAVHDNNLLLDFVKVSFNGTEYSERKHTEQVLDELIRTQYQGKLYLKYEFVARGIPEKLSLLTQNNRVVAILVNGKEIKILTTDYDPYFHTANISKYFKIGQNEIVFCIDFYENSNVHYAIYGENVTESLINMMSYDTVIEPIFLQGEFCVNDNFELTEFTLPTKTANIQKQGFPFFNGVMTIEGNIFVNGEQEKRVRLSGNFATAEVYVNDLKQGVAALSEQTKISNLKKGKNSIKILLKSTMRNMYGPHHCKGMQEDWGACPYMFTFFKQWRNGKPNDFVEEYNLAPFGLEKIEIED